MSTWSFMNIKGQGLHWPSSRVTTFSNFFSLETPRPIEAKFRGTSKDMEMKVSTNGLSHNQDGCHVRIWWKPLKILVTRVLPNLFKWWPWIDLDLFYSKVKFGPFCFCMGKCLSCRFPRNYWNLWGEYRCTNKWVHDDLWQPKAKVIHRPLSKFTQIHFQTSSPKKKH